MVDPVVLKSLAPVMVVDAIGPCLPFWERLGFAVTVCVPEEAPFAFAILAREGIEVMLQSRASVREDMPGVGERGAACIVYLTVGALEPVLVAVADAPVVVARRQTFYGSDEIFVEDPAGNVIGFSAPGAG